MKRKLVLSSFGVAAVQVIGAVLSLIATIVLTRTLTANEFGVYAYALSVMATARVFLVNGWITQILRLSGAATTTGDWRLTRGLAKRGSQISVGLTLLLGVGVLFVYILYPKILPHLFTYNSIAILTLILSMEALSSIRIGLLRGLDHSHLAQIPDLIIKPIALIACLIILYILTQDNLTFNEAFIALLIATTINLVTGVLLLRKKSPDSLKKSRATFDTWRWLLASFPLAGNAGLVILSSQLGILMLGIFGNASEVGFYRVAAQVASTAFIGYTALNFLAAQRFAALRTVGSDTKVQEIATFLSRVALAVSFPAPIILWIWGDEITATLFGEEFVPAVGSMIVLSIMQVINAGCGMTRTFLIMNGRESRMLMITLKMLVGNLFLCLILIPIWGPLGAAVSNLFASSLSNIELWWVVRREHRIDTSFLGIKL